MKKTYKMNGRILKKNNKKRMNDIDRWREKERKQEVTVVFRFAVICV